jgi:hypothetical protein
MHPLLPVPRQMLRPLAQLLRRLARQLLPQPLLRLPRLLQLL